VRALLARRALRELLGADLRVGGERLHELVLRQAGDQSVSRLERALDLGETLDEARPALEQLGELVDRQLPR
jgi:hypothetical protein